jgi:ketosteroid isomerase-like protein
LAAYPPVLRYQQAAWVASSRHGGGREERGGTGRVGVAGPDCGWEDAGMPAADPVLDLMDRFTAALNSRDIDAVLALVTDDVVFESTSPAPDGARYEGRDEVRLIWGQMLADTPQARFAVEEQFSDGAARAVVRWRYEWGGGHVRGVDIVRVRDGQLAESLAYVKG